MIFFNLTSPKSYFSLEGSFTSNNLSTVQTLLISRKINFLKNSPINENGDKPPVPMDKPSSALNGDDPHLVPTMDDDMDDLLEHIEEDVDIPDDDEEEEIDEDVELNNGSHEDLDLVPSETKKAKLEPNVDFGGSKSNNDHQINGMTGAGSSPGGINKLPPLPPLPPPLLNLEFLKVLELFLLPV